MGAIFGLLLAIFLFAFFGMESFVVNYLQAADLKILGISVLSPNFKLFLAVGILFCEFAIIMYSILDHVGNTIRDVIKPLVRILPLGAFLTTTYNTFSPLIFSNLPNEVGQTMGPTGYQTYSVAQAVNSGRFAEGILLTLGTMFLFVLASTALGERDSAQVKQLMAENRRYKKELRRGL